MPLVAFIGDNKQNVSQNCPSIRQVWSLACMVSHFGPVDALIDFALLKQ
jgi:hypothetical protein